MSFITGDKVEFLVPFENADARIEIGETGIIRYGEDKGLGDYVSVVAKGIIWLAKTSEIRLVIQQMKH